MKMKLKLQLYIATALLFIGCVLLIMGFWVAPVGIIDHSVLIAFGEIATFAGALIGVDYSYRYKVFKIKGEEEKEE